MVTRCFFTLLAAVLVSLTLSFGFPTASNANVSAAYEFSSLSAAYTEISGGTVHGTSSNDEDSFNAIDLGFTFNFDGVDYTQISIQSNGFIAMGAAVSNSHNPLITGSSNNVIAALGCDLQGNGVDSELQSLTEGTAPDRVFTVQWKKYKRYGASYSADNLNFQIKLYESSNRMKIVYGGFTVTNVATPPTAEVGLRGAAATDFNNRMTDVTHVWADSLSGTTNASAMSLTDTIYPASGLVYIWTIFKGVAIDPPQLSKTGCKGSDTVYNLKVWNYTGAVGRFNLNYAGAWPSSGPAATGDIPHNGSETVSVTVRIPRAANSGDSDVLTVTATDLSSTYTDMATATTIAGLARGYTDRANVPAGREARNPSVVYWDGKLFKIGGYNGAARAWVDIYDIAANTWTSGADMPGARYWMDCEAIAGKIYCAGGYLSSGQSTLYIYDIAGDVWTTGAAMPAARYNYASAALAGKYHVIGGYTGSYESTMLVYDPVANTWDSTRASMGTARRFFVAGAMGGKIYAAGGYNGSYLSSAEVYDPTANAWTPVAGMPQTWCSAGDAVVDDRFLVVLGGASTSTASASAYAQYYDATSDRWATLPDMNHWLYGTEAAGYGSEVWIASGRMYEGGGFSYSPYTTHMDQCVLDSPVQKGGFHVIQNREGGGAVIYLE